MQVLHCKKYGELLYIIGWNDLLIFVDHLTQIFMQADFSLEDPLTFQEVLPLSQLLPTGRKKKPAEAQHTLSSKLLHEKVSRQLPGRG